MDIPSVKLGDTPGDWSSDVDVVGRDLDIDAASLSDSARELSRDDTERELTDENITSNC
jgi:hypothetical protein